MYLKNSFQQEETIKHKKFKIKHVRNFIVRFITQDTYYVCEECHRIHKRDGKEIRLDDERENLLLYYLWYGSVCTNCYCKTIQTAGKLLRDAIIGR